MMYFIINQYYHYNYIILPIFIRELMITNNQPQQKKKKNQDWKIAAEAKKLKKQQDRQKEQQKQKVKQQPKKQIKDKQAIKPIEKQVHNQAKMIEQVQSPPLKQQKQSSIHRLIAKQIPYKKRDEVSLRKLLLEYSEGYFKSEDEILLASNHQIIQEWNELNIGTVVDIFNITKRDSKRKHIIRTRYEDVCYFKNTLTKILCGANYIFQNGVVLSQPGTLFLAILAKEFRIPFIVLCETYKYIDTALLDFDLQQEGELYDLITPDQISLLITQLGPINVCSIPTLISEFHKSLN